MAGLDACRLPARDLSPHREGGPEYQPLLTIDHDHADPHEAFSHRGNAPAAPYPNISAPANVGSRTLGTVGGPAAPLPNASAGYLRPDVAPLSFNGRADASPLGFGGHGNDFPGSSLLSNRSVNGALPGSAVLSGNRKDAHPDIVQFSSPFFYVVEGSETVRVTAMRIGTLMSPCSAEFTTHDNSAKAGLKYRSTKGRIDFLPGEEMKSLEIGIISDDAFDTNLDFKVELSNPINCLLGDHLRATRVMIIDDDVFPDNQYREAIMKEDMDKFGVRMLISFIKFALRRVPLVGWRAGWTLLLDQANNVMYLVGIWLNVYLVDVVFAVHKPESNKELWIPNQRLWTAVLVALGVLIPKALLTYFDFLKISSLSVAGKVKLHLKVNLFRKYLYYDHHSHAKVSAQELTKAMEGDINELVLNGFMVIFQLAEQTVKVGVILYFLVRKRPSSALPLLIYPIAMAFVLNMRYERTLYLKDCLRDAEKDTMTHLRASCDDISLIKEYNMRTAVVGKFEDSIKAQGPVGDGYRWYDFRTMLVMPWITNFAIAIFMIAGGHFVLTDQLSLGAYLATIGIYKDAGELFSGFYGHLKECYGVIGPLLRVVRLLALETDVSASMKQAEERNAGMLKELKEEELRRQQFKLAAPSVSRFDMLHIKLINASLSTDRGGPAHPGLQDINAEVPQGKMVAILGPHGSGKYTTLRLLTGLIKPRNGQAHVPTHLRCLCVSNIPEIYKNGNLLENLTFGCQGKFDKGRLIKLCGALGLGEHTMELVEKELKDGPNANQPAPPHLDDKRKLVKAIPWYEQLSQMERLKMHITRALNLNPEVLLLHRPVDEMEADHAARVLDVFRQHVDNKGLFLAPDSKQTARPHTLFFTTGEDRERAESAADVADVVWHVSDKGFRAEPGGRHAQTGEGGVWKPHAWGAGNKIVNSWSREVRTLQVDLEKEKHLHTATLEELETQQNEAHSLRTESEHTRAQLNDVVSQAKRALRDARNYEVELEKWEAEKSGGFFYGCVDRGVPPNPKVLSRSLHDMIEAGEGRKDGARSPQQSPPGYNSARPGGGMNPYR